MIFKETKLKGAYVIELEKAQDERGFFAYSYCQKEFQEHGIDLNIVQCNVSYNKARGTLRGMHYQSTPFEQAKLVSCIKGRIYDVIIDLREDSCTYRKSYALELGGEDYRMLYIPKGFAHGYQTLEDDSVVFYQMSEFYHPECAKGVRWDDPLFSIKWPLDVKVISKKDKKCA
ncbi:MAG: dTDP-4-dehydrorhamnose 3,5-epimerase [Candidatus Omnitrophota bacterium]|nr:dTDP-4-dehydrorhamnose 3,5-epimerase [Candidatus Omnitrophota bacterium]